MPTPGESPQCLQPGLARLIEESLPRWLCPASGLGQGTPKLSRTLWPHSHLAALSMELGASSPCGLAGCQFAARSVPTPEAAAACGTQPPGTAQVSSEVSPEPPWAGVHLVTEAPRRQSERLLHQAFQGRGWGEEDVSCPWTEHMGSPSAGEPVCLWTSHRAHVHFPNGRAVPRGSGPELSLCLLLLLFRGRGVLRCREKRGSVWLKPAPG